MMIRKKQGRSNIVNIHNDDVDDDGGADDDDDDDENEAGQVQHGEYG